MSNQQQSKNAGRHELVGANGLRLNMKTGVADVPVTSSSSEIEPVCAHAPGSGNVAELHTQPR